MLVLLMGITGLTSGCNIPGLVNDRLASDRGGSNTTKSPEGPLTVDLGATFDVGGLTLSDTEFYQLGDLEALGQSRPPRGVYIVFFAEVANNGSKGYGLNSAFQKLHIGGKEYQGNPFLGKGSGSVYLEPGFAGSEVFFIFDVPTSSMAGRIFAEKTYVEVTSLDLDAPRPREVNVRLPSVEEPLPRRGVGR